MLSFTQAHRDLRTTIAYRRYLVPTWEAVCSWDSLELHKRIVAGVLYVERNIHFLRLYSSHKACIFMCLWAWLLSVRPFQHNILRISRNPTRFEIRTASRKTPQLLESNTPPGAVGSGDDSRVCIHLLARSGKRSFRSLSSPHSGGKEEVESVHFPLARACSNCLRPYALCICNCLIPCQRQRVGVFLIVVVVALLGCISPQGNLSDVVRQTVKENSQEIY